MTEEILTREMVMGMQDSLLHCKRRIETILLCNASLDPDTVLWLINEEISRLYDVKKDCEGILAFLKDVREKAREVDA